MVKRILYIRLILLLLSLIVIVLGILSTRESMQYIGDFLWAFLIVLIIKFIFINLKSMPLFLLAFIFCILIEISQLLHFEWLVALRGTLLVYLLGHGTFSYVDLLLYLLGVCASIILISLISRVGRNY